MAVSWSPVGGVPDWQPLGNLSGIDVATSDTMYGDEAVLTRWEGRTTVLVSPEGHRRLVRWVEREELLAEARLIAREVVRRWATRRGY